MLNNSFKRDSCRATPVTFLFDVPSLANYQRQFLSSSSVLKLCMSFTALVLTTCIPILPTRTHLVLLKQTFQMRRCRWEKPRGSQSSAAQVGSVTVYSPLHGSRTMTVACKTRALETGFVPFCRLNLCSNLNRTMFVIKQPNFSSQPLALLHMNFWIFWGVRAEKLSHLQGFAWSVLFGTSETQRWLWNARV